MRTIAATITTAASLLFLTVPASHAQASAYPNKPIRIIVAYAAGQGTDVATRLLGEQLSRELGQPIVVENKAGAGGILGTELAAQAAGDGYTLTMGTNATHVLNQFLYAKMPFDPEKDFEPIAMVGTFPMVLATGASTPYRTVGDVLDTVKRTPGSADIAMPSTSARLVVEFLKDRSGAPLFGIPYKGSGSAMTDVLGGQLSVTIDTPLALRPHLAAGKLRALGVTSAIASPLVPGVKPVAEQGYAGFEFVAWNALYAPKGTPAEITRVLNAAVNKVLAKPDVRQRLLDLGFEPAGGSAAYLGVFARKERERWAPIIKTAGIRAD
ncbi:tripartite-type tricarboxylate transporter receptor subunit TctC [Acidovorax sp. 69]|uniref:Bug family tripartite tricarboxylate transporter substrate binding protein n=1 Tax=Acidovorax sp. 69 TaxID=2035202 RepID=UPI000C23BDF4|nr:tripartite tricarboxylate transporter substrate binding protein [Acidovorax sp. 69]PJI98392.1 tripartite-type tricarboxylate transporter receptor subunit TctC [Acidovorax sp. 69]